MKYNRILHAASPRGKYDRPFADLTALTDLSAGNGVAGYNTGPIFNLTTNGTASVAQLAETLNDASLDAFAWTYDLGGAFWSLPSYMRADIMSDSTTTAPATAGTAFIGMGAGQFVTATSVSTLNHVGIRFNLKANKWETLVADKNGAAGTPVTGVVVTANTTLTRPGGGSWVTDNVYPGDIITGTGVPATTRVVTVDPAGLIITVDKTCTTTPVTITPTKLVFIRQFTPGATGVPSWANATGYRLEIIYQSGYFANFYINGTLLATMRDSDSGITPSTPFANLKTHGTDGSAGRKGLNIYCTTNNAADTVNGYFFAPFITTYTNNQFPIISDYIRE